MKNILHFAGKDKHCSDIAQSIVMPLFLEGGAVALITHYTKCFDTNAPLMTRSSHLV